MRWSAKRCKARRRRAGVIKGAFGRRLALDVRMQREQARTVTTGTATQKIGICSVAACAAAAAAAAAIAAMIDK